MAEGEKATGTPNTIYDLSSVLFHALKGGASYDAYIEDAEREGDEELAEFFRRVREEDNDRSNEARLLLAQRTPPIAVRAEGTRPDVPPLPEPSSEFPGTEPVAGEGPPGRTGEVPPPPEEIPPERAGEIPSADEVPLPRAEEVPGAAETPTGIPPQAPPADPRRGTPFSRGEVSPRAEEASPEVEEAPPSEERRRAREREDGDFVDEALHWADGGPGRGEQRREGDAREDRT